MSKEDKDRAAIINRLRRIEGQVKGIQKMVYEEKVCGDILIQIAAVRSALNKVGGMILEDHMKDCIKTSLENGADDDVIDGLIDTILKYTK
ncbi:metal-sensitive transcriptional regulator [Anaerosalibacter bizertensis]|uniref:Metal-sensitive transcriptional regulator n=1 Tax=Anaerosalibacter bizertensis TaxID=932217 RepID=A0A844FJT3_9FIRM|nr:metal-sensitive transcriptional regulator [Anaerosalibacter bizertensis]MBV1817457.1 metal-sensitive transcriptional regulator [Bacteroidales bacterium MSK.15.36]HHV27755.1 metal-sensitive transcriptional regulator [Tissierellia bacterium]MBU5293389.1 metal-sensitive transcriptional regulator [Anaerosalibacter bizertensis]MCB5559243.1 metal-sensitive transcriptional regulator [Anaerosalibacter bizertensis]MCG4564031.1 metal-sensitive transcriptional regulator [Anaerosalibacter bizertensis]